MIYFFFNYINLYYFDLQELTGCTCSVGFGPNRLISRLATKIAKPNGQLCITNREVGNFIKNIPISYLPGANYNAYHQDEKNYNEISSSG